MRNNVRNNVRNYTAVFFGIVPIEKRAGDSLCILSGEIGGGSTEALICLGISVSEGL